MKKQLIVFGVIIIALAAFGAWYTSQNTVAPTPTAQDVMEENTPPEVVPQTPTTTPQSTPAQEAPENENTPPVTKPDTSPAKEFVISGKNFSFSPSSFTVRKGDRVRIVFQNTGGTHDLKIDEFGVATKKIGSGIEDVVEFTASKTGSFEYYCSVGSHRAMGMRGTLVVTE